MKPPDWQTPDGSAVLYHSDCFPALLGMDAESVDAVVTDPPAGIGFMGKDWDHDKGGRDSWIAWMQSVAHQCLRVLKPGGHALVWSLPRTSHWTATAWENAGFEVRDRIAHCFGSGFPKSLDVSKAIDKAAGAERERIRGVRSAVVGATYAGDEWSREFKDSVLSSDPITDAARRWSGWGTALKPAVEDWWLLRKPLIGSVAENVLRYGTGAINVDGCRVGTEPAGARSSNADGITRRNLGFGFKEFSGNPSAGRFPANLVHDGSPEVVELFPVTGKSSGRDSRGRVHQAFTADARESVRDDVHMGFGDSGSAARFFYCAKASKADRDEGCEGMEAVRRPNGNKWTDQDYRVASGERSAGRESGPRRNVHPTVKATALMRYLCRLVTPPGGVVLDPFAGSGSTGKAAILEGFRFIGIEMNREYMDIAAARIGAAWRKLDGTLVREAL